MAWEADFSRMQWRKNHWYTWARNPESRFATAREWHWVTDTTLKQAGVWQSRAGENSWEVDWSKRTTKAAPSGRTQEYVWARNPTSRRPRSRNWHWTPYSVIVNAGIRWQPRKERNGKHVNGRGYRILSIGAMTKEEIRVADEFDLWVGRTGNRRVLEHVLVAVMTYGERPEGMVVRHLNGDKLDNSPDNLIYGTPIDNRMDHVTALKEARHWQQRALRAERELEQLRVFHHRDGDEGPCRPRHDAGDAGAVTE